MSYQGNITAGINFLGELVSNVAGWYWEVPEVNDAEHKIYPQSQYLLYITFKRLKQYDLARQIDAANLFHVPATDSELIGNTRYCVLDNDAPPFYLAGKNLNQLQNYDEVALLDHYLAITDDMQNARQCSSFLKTRWNQKFNALGMDQGDSQANGGQGLFRIYKTALAGTLFARVGETTSPNCQSTAVGLQALQDTQTGGWVTDRTADWEPNGLQNIETTCLALICLSCAQNGGTQYSINFP